MADQKTITWKAEVEFVGQVEDFVQFAETLSKVQARVEIVDRIRFDPSQAGYVAPRFIDTPHVYQLLDKAQVQRIPGLINGGIRTPHFHIGREIALVDRDQFKTILGEVARDVFEHRALQHEDYLEVITPLVQVEG
jgi:predicted class III extradiol MEMO1 family dioxygenase